MRKPVQMSQMPVISIIIPTIGRPTLRRAVQSALEQELPEGDLEVIVVNDSGQPLDHAIGLPADSRITVVTTNRRGLSVARNTGAAVAKGRYLLFLDDDDWLATNALIHLLCKIAQDPEHVVVYGGVRLVDDAGRTLGTLNLGMAGNCACHMLAGAWIPCGSALIVVNAYFTAGGTDVKMGPSEEMDMFRRLAMMGTFGNTSEIIVNVLRGSGWATTVNYEKAVNNLRISRERVLDQKAALPRMIQSAQGPYWQGRVLKAYLASLYWNTRERRLMTAISRALSIMRILLSIRLAWLHPDFWQALRDSQVPATAQRVLNSTLI